jgi:hypothetical protein
VWGANLRFYPISQPFLERVKRYCAAENIKYPAAAKSPRDFCQMCETCQYRTASCEIMEMRRARRPDG